MSINPLPSFRELPPQVNGYELFPSGGAWSIVVPEAGKNLVPNPSFELGTTGWGFSNCTIAVSQDYTMRGQNVLKVTPNAASSQINYIGIADQNGTNYCVSFDVVSPESAIFLVKVDVNLSTTVTLSGQVQASPVPSRVSFPFACSGAGQTYTINLTIQKVTNSLGVWYVDGVQVEPNGYGTTYIDGDQTGCSWLSAPHASQSIRAENARGGHVYSFDRLGFKIFNYSGFGLPPSENVTLQKGIQGGEQLQRKANKKRALTLSGIIQAGGLYNLQQLRKVLVNTMTSDNISQEVRALSLWFQQVDSCGVQIGTLLEMPVSYIAGLEGLADNIAQERIAIQFGEFSPPSIKEIYPVYSALTIPPGASSNGYGIVEFVNPKTQWKSFTPTGSATEFFTAISNPMAINQYGLGAGFYGFGGSGLKIMGYFYDAGSGDFANQQLINTFASGAVYALLYQNGTLYAGGSFTSPQNYITSWTVGPPVVQVNIPTAGGPAATVRTLVADQYGNFYAGGDGTANSNRFLKLLGGGTWYNTGSLGINGAVLCSLLAQNGTIYIGGNFTSVEGLAANYIAQYTPNNTGTLVIGPFATLGTGMNGIVRCIAQAPNGTLYAGGDFTQAGGVTVNYIAQWNGTAWAALGRGLNGAVYSMAFDQFGNLLVSGNFNGEFGSTASNQYPSKLAVWNGSTWRQGPFSIFNTPNMGLVANIYNNVIASTQAAGVAGNGLTLPTLTTVTSTATAGVYPVITFTVPSSAVPVPIYQIINYRTNKALNFNYTVLAGETLTISTDPNDGRVVSSIFGNVPRAILPGSDLGVWGLSPGQNLIGLYIGNTTTTTKVSLNYRNTHWSLDAGVQ